MLKILERNVKIGVSQVHVEVNISPDESPPQSGFSHVKYYVDGHQVHSCDFDSIIRMASCGEQGQPSVMTQLDY